MRELCYDIAPIRKARILDNGTMAADAHLTRIGIFEYRQPDGSTVRRLRLPEEVFDPDAMESLEHLPVTNDHPVKDDGKFKPLTPDIARQYTIGAVGERVSRDGDYIKASVAVYDADTIAQIKAGKRQVSVGYWADVEQSPGVWRGERYDEIQRNLRGNHLAIVDKGRAGPGAALYIDTQEAEPMKQIKIGSKEFEVDEAVATRFDELTKEAEAAKADAVTANARADDLDKATKTATDQVKTLTADVADAKAKADKAQARADAATEASDPAKLQAAITARVALETEAHKHLTADTALEGMTDRQVKEAVVKNYSPKIDLSKASDDYVSARYDAAIEQPTDALMQARVAAADSADPPQSAEQSAAQTKAMYADAWKTTGPRSAQRGA